MLLHRLAARCLILVVLGAAACSRDPEVAKREYVQSGDEYLADGKVDEAIIQYQNAIQQDPRFGEAYFKLATAAMRKGDLQTAYEESLRAADLLPEDVDAQVLAGQMHVLAKQFPDAQSRAERALALDGDNVDAHILLGNALAGLQDLDAAVSQVEQAIATDPDRADAYASLGGLQFVRGNREEAEAAFLRGVQIAPDSIDARLALGNFYLFSGRMDRVEGVLRDALEIEPTHVLANRGLYLLYRSLGRHAEAEAPLKVIVDSTNAPEAKLALADYYASTGRTGDAMALLDAMASESATYAVASVRKATILRAEGRLDEAGSLIDEVLSSRGNNVDALVAKSQLLVDDGKLDEALQHAERARRADPQAPAAHFAAGRILAARGEIESAISAFNDVLRLASGSVETKLQLARLHLAADRPESARTFADQVLESRRDDPDAALVRARALTRQGNAAVAEASVVELAERIPDSATVRALLGTVYAAQGKLSPAGEAWQRTLDLDPDNIEAHRGLMSIDFARNDTAAAVARADRLVAARPDTPELLLLAAEAYRAAGQQEKTEETLRHVMNVAPDTLDAYGMLGRLYASQNRIDEALTEFGAIVERDPNSVSAHTVMAMLLEAKGDRDEARKAYERVIEIDRSAPVAANNLAYIYAETDGNLDVALGLAQTAKEGLPDSPQVDDTLGWIYHKKGLHSLAVPPLLRSIDQDPGDPLFHYHLGMVYAATGETSKARASLEKALALDASFPGAAEARRVLSELKG